MNTLCINTKSKTEAIKLAKDHQLDFYNIAKQTILDSGYSYDVNVKIGNFDFPTKKYGDISFPAGNYDALRVEIGKAEGQNWWCVMFPPLCFVDMTSGIVPDESKENLETALPSEEEYILIAPSYMICNIDLKEALEYHKKNCTKLKIKIKKLLDFIFLL